MYAPLFDFLNNPAFMPHGNCFLWTPALLDLYVVAESMIFTSYFAIPAGLIYFVRRRADFPYKPLLCLFGLFITLCGATHLVDLWNIWNSAYWFEAWVKLATGVVSAVTALTLFPLIPRALNLPSQSELEMANSALRTKLQELEMARSALADSEQRYRQLVETAREGIWVLDNSGSTVFANDRLGEMLGCRAQEMHGLPLLDFVEPSQRAAARDRLDARYSIAGQAPNLTSDTDSFDFRRHDGSVVHTIFSTSPVQDGSGACTGLLAVVADITEREKIAQDLSLLTITLEQQVAVRTAALKRVNDILVHEISQRTQAQDHLQAVLNAAADGIIVADTHGQILTINPAVEKIFQYGAEIVGKPLSLLMPEPFKREHDSYLSNYLQTGRAKVIGVGREVVGRRGDGTEFPLDLAVGVIRQENVTQFVGVVRDISERKAAQREILTLNERLSQTNAELREQSANISTLNHMNELLPACVDVKEAGAVIQRCCRTLFAADAGNLLLVDDDDRHTLVTVSAWGDTQECEHEFVHQNCWALRQAKPYPTIGLQHSLRCVHLNMGDARVAICLPLFGQGEVLGVLVLRGGWELTNIVAKHDRREQRSWLQAFAEHVSLALANIKLRRRLRDESIRDPLTGLFNRRHLRHELQRIWATMARTDDTLALLMVDVDHFKRINDSHGHDIGDQVLCEMARRLQRHSRPGDVLARYGGEEFLVVLPGATLDIAQQRAVDICFELSRYAVRLDHDTNITINVSVSIGVAAGRRSEKGGALELLLSRADQALYDAKMAGRNRVEIYQTKSDDTAG